MTAFRHDGTLFYSADTLFNAWSAYERQFLQRVAIGSEMAPNLQQPVVLSLFEPNAASSASSQRLDRGS